MRYLIHILLISAVVALASCSSQQPTAPTAKPKDSLAVKVGLYPSLDALPMLLAQEWGIFDSLGVGVEISIYKSQIDAEQALIAGKADLSMSDNNSVAWWKQKRKPIELSFYTHRPVVIVPARQLRITNAAQLDDRMIAIAPHTQEDKYAQAIVQTIPKRKGQILYPQINDPELRLHMLLANQIDAAILPRLQAYKAQAAGYRTLAVSVPSPHDEAGFAHNPKTYDKKSHQISLVQLAYNLAVGRLHKMQNLSSISLETHQRLHITPDVDSLSIPSKDFQFTSPGKIN